MSNCRTSCVSKPSLFFLGTYCLCALPVHVIEPVGAGRRGVSGEVRHDEEHDGRQVEAEADPHPGVAVHAHTRAASGE